MTKRIYQQPQTEALHLCPETLICLSGNSEKLIIDDTVNPWSVSSEAINSF